MYVHIALLLAAVKALFINSYRSTDFEVHRNWLAITHNLTLDKWYYDTTSEWTLDYPPFFAWLEYALSHVAKFFDPKMLELTNLNYASQMTILFQRFSVIALDSVYIFGAKRLCDHIGNGRMLAFLLLVGNPGLLMVDHIHFQYNGFLYGILLISIADMIRSNFIRSAFWFAVLLNFKHIFIYVAPVYVVFLLRAYCITAYTKYELSTPWYSFSVTNLCKLAATVVFVFGLSFGPFINHIPQILSRLFPFKRGLSHAYWAPNYWALYNLGDKFLQHALPKVGYAVAKTEASMTGGLVQEFSHAVLPSVQPAATIALTLASMIPALFQLWFLGADQKYRAVNFVRCMVVCATCSFMFGWHVHEKAILMILIPLSFLSVLGGVDGKMFLFLSTVGHYSLFPLLYPPNLLPIKLFMLLTHMSLGFGFIPYLYVKLKPKQRLGGSLFRLTMLDTKESLYLYGLLVLCIYEHSFHVAWGLHKTLPFLPLMITSAYCAVGVTYFWILYYLDFLFFNLSWSSKYDEHKIKVK